MRKFSFLAMMTAGILAGTIAAQAQYRTDVPQELPKDDSATVISLDKALEIALSENVSVQVADQEITRTQYAKKGTYGQLFPQIDLTGSYSRTLKKQVMYMSMSSTDEETGETVSTSTGIEVGMDNTYSGGVTASMPLINAQLWKSIKISGLDVELAVEQARSSRLDMVTQVKQAYYAVLLAKEAFYVYRDVYENAVENFKSTELKYNAEKASELDYTRAKANVANAIPDVYNSESSVILTLWQLKAVMGVDLDMNIDVEGTLDDYAETMFRDIHELDDYSLDYNTTMRQLAIQADQLAQTVRLQKYAYLPTLSLAFSHTYNAMENSFKFSEYKWTPYSYIALSLTIPIFSGGQRYHSVKQAQVQAKELELNTKDTERQLKISIRSYLNTMETNMNTYYSAEEAVELAQKAYDISAKTYEVGKNTLTDLNDAQLTLTQSELAKSQAVYNFLVAKSSLEQILGYDFVDEDGNTDLENM